MVFLRKTCLCGANAESIIDCVLFPAVRYGRRAARSETGKVPPAVWMGSNGIDS